MTRVRRRTVWGIALGALLLIGMAVYGYFVGTRTLLEAAEAFSFRRMTTAQLAETGAFRFFYATNRRPGVTDAGVEERFLSERGPSLSFGSFDTRIEPALGLGMIVDPSDWFLNEEIQLTDVLALGREAFVAQLRDQVEASPRRSLLVVVHGFREAYPSALRKTAFLLSLIHISEPTRPTRASRMPSSA